MLEAWILVCLSVLPDMCVELRDTRGPYETKQACRTRTIEMETLVIAQHLFPVDTKWRCKFVSENDDESTSPDTQKEGTDPTTRTVPRIAL